MGRGAGSAEQLGPSVAQERGRVELALAHERLRIDREPPLPRHAQDVAAVEVLVEDDGMLALALKLNFRTAARL